MHRTPPAPDAAPVARGRRHALLAAVLLPALAAIAPAQAPLTPGNVLVVRVGDGSAPLDTTAAPLFLEEWSPAPTAALVQTIDLTNGGTNAITAAGAAPYEGFLTISGDGRYFVCAGYQTAAGTAAVGSSTSAAVPRAIARISRSGAIDTTTALTDAISGGSPTSAVSDDGSQFWICGTPGAVRYALGLGATTSLELSPTPADLRVLGIPYYPGAAFPTIGQRQLHVSASAPATYGIGTVGTGLPTTAGTAITLLPGFPTTAGPSTCDAFFAGANTIYVADDRAIGSGGGLQKWTFDGSTWSLAYTLDTNLTSGLRGVTGDATAPTRLYATTADAASQLVSVVDQGSNLASPFTTLATAATDRAFRGVRYIPELPPTLTAQPSPAVACAGGSSSFAVTATGNGLQYRWYKDGAPAGTGPAYEQSTLLLSNVTVGDAGSYRCLVFNSGGQAFSDPATLTVEVAPAITAQPSNAQACVGTAASFSVTATGTAPLAYQWRKNGLPIGGATAAAFALPSVLAADAGAYDCEVTNTCGSIVSAIATLTVDEAPAITAQPSDAQACVGTAASFSVTATGTAPLAYQWRKNGSPIGGATAATFALPSVLAADAGAYDCEVTNACGSITSAIATLTVDEAPAITAQPSDAQACVGTAASFSITATGTAPLAYQWRKNGSPISGATAATFALPSVLAADAGAYDCEVTNACGSIVSAIATLTVDEAPAITAQPSDAQACVGTAASFSITATGTAPLTYQWRKNGSPIGGATAATFALPSVLAADAGAYDCEVTNACGSIVSAIATLTVDEAPAITAQPSDAQACVGTAASFSVTATGTAPLAYQWRKNGSPIGGATAATFALPSVLAADAGAYDCEITNACGSITSAIATLTVDEAPAITAQPSDAQACVGTAASFSITATGTAPLTYQWRKNGSPIGGATAATFALPSVLAADAGAYDCEVTNACGSIVSAIATLTVDEAPAITAQPSDVQACVGTAASFSVTATGTAPLAYQWRKNGSPIGGATAATFALPSVLATDAGAYDCEVTNACGSITSAIATLTVDEAPAITAQPSDAQACAGTAASFSITATGTAPLTYQWRKNGSPIGGATAATFALPSVLATDAGAYDCEITNACGSITSAIATLTVDEAPAITAQPSDAQACVGTAASFSVTATGTAPLAYQWRKNGSPIGGATAATFALPSVLAADAGAYDCEITNACGSITSAIATLTVDEAPAITAQPSDAQACVGTAASFSITATGTAPLAYQWRKNGSPIGGATAATFALPSVLATDAGAYDCEVTNACGSITSAIATLTVDEAPAITAQPSDAQACVGTAASFSITATGTAPLAYQWRKNGSPIGGATAATFALPSVLAADAGAYDCEVTNGCGSIVSAIATLTVDAVPEITAQPSKVQVCSGKLATFTVAASGTPPLAFQWRRNGVPVPGATNATLVIAAAVAADVGHYDCEVTNACGPTVSGAAELVVDEVPTIAGQPVPMQVCAGDSASFAITATGSVRLSYAWRKNGVPIPGAEAATLLIAATTSGDAATYSCFVRNDCGEVLSNAVALVVDEMPAITAQPVDVQICAGGAAAFAVSASGSAPLAYQWRKNGTPIVGATAATLTLAAAVVDDAGAYDCAVTNACGTATSGFAALTVDESVALTAQPADVRTCAGDAAAFAVTATGTAPISYQWRKDGAPIPGATAATLSLPTTVVGDAGAYDCVVGNLCGSVTSGFAALVVDEAPAITAQPDNAQTCAGDPVAFAVTATGSAPLSFQWRKNGAPIPGATAATLSLPTTVVGDAGVYDCAIGNACGAIVSAAATLQVDAAAAVTSQPSSLSILVGNAIPLAVGVAGTPPLSIQWRKDGAPIPGAVATTLTIAAATAGDAGAYDVVVANACGTVTSQLAIVTVTDSAEVDAQCLPFTVGSLRTAVGDFVAGDGDDVIVADGAAGNVRLCVNDGRGRFTASTTVGVAASPRGLAVADFDGDGHLDFAVACAAGSAVQVHYGDGLGGFGAPVTIAATAPLALVAIAVQGHPRADLAIADLGAVRLAVNLANTIPAARAFAAPTVLIAGASFTAVAAADVTGDGSPDLTALDGSSGLVHVVHAATLLPAMAPLAGGVGAQALALADVNGDERADIAVGSISGVRLLRTPSMQSLLVDPRPTVAITAGRFDVSGSNDLAYVTTGGDLVLLHDPQGTIAPTQFQALPSPATSIGVQRGALNAAGAAAGAVADTDELVVARTTGDVCIVRLRAVAAVTPIAGTGCSGGTPVASTFGGSPFLGNSAFGSALDAATPASFAVLAYQVHLPTGSPPVLLPLGLCTHAFAGPGELPFLFAIVDGSGHTATPLPVPAIAQFLGFEFPIQWAVLDGGDPFTGITLSQALLLRIGEY